MWKNFGNTQTKIKILVAVMLLVGVGVITLMAIGVDNKSPGETSLAVPDGDAGENDGVIGDAKESQAEPMGVTEKTEPTDNESGGEVVGATAYGRGAVVDNSVSTYTRSTTSSNVVQVVSVSSDGAVERMEIPVDNNSSVVESGTENSGVEVAKADNYTETSKNEVAVVNERENVITNTNNEVAVIDASDNTDPIADEVNDVVISSGEPENKSNEDNKDNIDAVIDEDNRGNESNDENEISDEDETEAERLAREKAEREAELEKQKEIQGNFSGSSLYSGANTYPWQNDCPEKKDSYLTYVETENGWRKVGGYVCECVSYAGWKAYEAYGVTPAWGYAYSWTSSAIASGYVVNHTPEAGTIGQMVEGPYGHVFWVEGVNEDGSIYVTEYNNSWSTSLLTGSYHAGDYGARTISAEEASRYNYIHFK